LFRRRPRRRLELRRQIDVAILRSAIALEQLKLEYANPFAGRGELLGESGTGLRGRRRVAGCLEARGERVALSVADNGAGMTAAVRARAFEEFFTTKPKGKGCGIGLALSRRLLAENGADIDIASHAGRGTVATVRLPVLPQGE
jgi:signal transduction histidine kinase